MTDPSTRNVADPPQPGREAQRRSCSLDARRSPPVHARFADRTGADPRALRGFPRYERERAASARSSRGITPRVRRALARRFLTLFDENFIPEKIWSIGIGQNIYTPNDITIPTPQLNDRHWSGLLYLDNSLHLIDKDETKRHVIELQAGIVGRASGARWAQATVHEIINSPEPVGWPNQLKNENGVNLDLRVRPADRRRRYQDGRRRRSALCWRLVRNGPDVRNGRCRRTPRQEQHRISEQRLPRDRRR